VYDCSAEIRKYHDDRVTLPTPERTSMRRRRDANRDRLRVGLKKDEKPLPYAFHSQGSYRMRTMIQVDDLDYDIDDGVYFYKDALKDSSGADMSPEDARTMVEDALQDDRFNDQPEARDNCVRIYYEAGYHVDMPIYRVSGDDDEIVELASGSQWRNADARGVTRWFEDENDRLSPKDDGEGQFRRNVRLNKKFARSRSDWKEPMPSGLAITKLCSEIFAADKEREDRALRQTMTAMRDRLNRDLLIKHPVVEGETITNGKADPKAIFLREQLTENLKHLEALDRYDCTREDALKAWGKVFNDSWFEDQIDPDDKTATAGPAILSSARSDYPVVDKQGGGRYA
jgi:cyclic GMP-AMP synthase DncV-like protein